jgi:hypothetical protein
MAAILLPLSLVACTIGVGLGPLRRQPAVERWLLAVAVALFTLSLVSILLVRLAVFSPFFTSAALLAVGATLRFAPWFRDPVPHAAAVDFDDRGGVPLAALLVVLFSLYAFFPTYFLLGGQDPGVYLAYAARIAKAGALDLDLPWLRQVWAEHPVGISLGYPGVYSSFYSGITTDPSQLSPQFAHLFPALLANAWCVAGLEGALRVNAFIAVLALWAAFAFTRRLAGPWAGLAVVVVLGLNPAFIWGARITLTEEFALLFNLLGLFLLAVAYHAESPRGWGLAGGLLLGLGTLNRLDAGLSSLAVLGFALSALFERRLRGAAKAAAVGCALTMALGFADAARFAPFYFQTLVAREHLVALMVLCAGCCGGAFVLGSISDSLASRLRLTPELFGRIGRELLRLLAIWLALALFAWPAVDPSSEARTARELAWYLTPAGLPLCVVGMAFCLNPIAPRYLPLLVLGAATLFNITVGAQITPVHIWASRRLLPHVLPAVAVLSVIAAVRLATLVERVRVPRHVVSLLFGLAYLIPAMDVARPFLFRSMLRGLPEAYAALIQKLPNGSHRSFPIVTSSAHLAAILTYVYDVPTVVLGGTSEYGLGDRGAREALGRGELSGLQAVGMHAFELHNSPTTRAVFQGSHLEEVSGRKARQVVPFPMPFDIGTIGASRFDIEVPAHHLRFPSQVGVPQPDGSLRTTGRAGYVQGGPCMDLAPGQYEVDWIGRVLHVQGGQERQGTVDAIARGDKARPVPEDTLVSTPLRLRPSGKDESWLAGVDFTLPRPSTCVEFRLQVEPHVSLELTRVRLRNVGPAAVTAVTPS